MGQPSFILPPLHLFPGAGLSNDPVPSSLKTGRQTMIGVGHSLAMGGGHSLDRSREKTEEAELATEDRSFQP